MKVLELKNYQHSFSLSLLYSATWVKLISTFARVAPCEKGLEDVREWTRVCLIDCTRALEEGVVLDKWQYRNV